MLFWQVVVILSLIAGVFIVWPLIRFPFSKKNIVEDSKRDETQIALYNEHLEDLDRAKEAGDLDEEQYQELKLELQKTLITEEGDSQKLKFQSGGKRMIIATAVVIPLIALVLYSQTGQKKDWDIYQALEELPQAKTQEAYSKKLRELSVMAQARLKQTPDNLQLMNMYAEMSMALQDYDQAVKAYQKILDAVPESARTMANLAQAMFYRAGNQVTDEVREYTQAALKLAPMLPEMLGLAGIDAKNRGDYREAIRYWKLAMSQMNPKSRTAQQYADGIAKAEQALKASGQSLDSGEQAAEGAASDAQVTLKVNVASDVSYSPSDTLFVYARAHNGPKMPLAIKRLPAANFPVTIVLDESMAMAPGMTIKSFPELELVARISKSGGAVPQSGDWQATHGPIKLDELSGAIDVTIAKQIP